MLTFSLSDTGVRRSYEHNCKDRASPWPGVNFSMLCLRPLSSLPEVFSTFLLTLLRNVLPPEFTLVTFSWRGRFMTKTQNRKLGSAVCSINRRVCGNKWERQYVDFVAGLARGGAISFYLYFPISCFLKKMPQSLCLLRLEDQVRVFPASRSHFSQLLCASLCHISALPLTSPSASALPVSPFSLLWEHLREDRLKTPNIRFCAVTRRGFLSTRSLPRLYFHPRALRQVWHAVGPSVWISGERAPHRIWCRAGVDTRSVGDKSGAPLVGGNLIRHFSFFGGISLLNTADDRKKCYKVAFWKFYLTFLKINTVFFLQLGKTVIILNLMLKRMKRWFISSIQFILEIFLHFSKVIYLIESLECVNRNFKSFHD